MSNGFWKDYFSFTRRERAAVLVLVFTIAIFILLPGFFAPKFSDVSVDEALQKRLDSLTAPTADIALPSANEDNDNGVLPPAVQSPDVTLKPFRFNPNQLSAEGFRKMGLPEKNIVTIMSYRSKGGVFHKPEDIRKIYGLSKGVADQLIPFITTDENTASQKSKADDALVAEPAKAVDYKKIEINSATEEEWKALPGIGDVLSKRIVKFRNSIHGFKSVEDVKRTYGLTDSTFMAILPYLTINNRDQINN